MSGAVEPQVDRTEVRRAIVGASIGNFVEWYDFGLYGIFATVFATLFFPRAIAQPHCC